jgi:hypothetical protein
MENFADAEGRRNQKREEGRKMETINIKITKARKPRAV